MLEGVLDIGQRGLFIDELTHLQIAEHPFQLVVGLFSHLPDQSQGELLAHHRQCLK